MSVPTINQSSSTVISNTGKQTANNDELRPNFAYLLRQNHTSLNSCQL